MAFCQNVNGFSWTVVDTMRPLCLGCKGTALSLRYEVYDAPCTDNNGIMWMALFFYGRLWL